MSQIQQFVLMIQTICFLYIFHLHFGHSYNLECPKAVQWKLRAKGKCSFTNDTDKYFCLFDVLKKEYTEGCRGPDWDRKGSKRVISGDFTRGYCSSYRYQPFDFWTNGSSECVYNKTVCAEEGQIISSNGSGYLDRTCRCDFARGYNYTQPPADLCSCKPSVEDCSCVWKDCCDLHDINTLDLQCPKMTLQDSKEDQDVSTKSVKTIQNSIQDPIRGARFYVTGLVCSTLVLIVGMTLMILAVEYEPRCIFKTKIYKSLQGKFYDSIQENSSTKDRVDFRDSTSMNANQSAENSSTKDRVDCKDSNSLNADQSDNSEESSNASEILHNETGIEKGEIFTEDEINYLRIVHLLFGITSPVVRMVFNEEIKPDELWPTLVKSGKILKYNRMQNGILSRSNEGKTISSDLFDIKFIIYLLKDLKIISIGDRLPLRSDTRKDALLSRILYYRTVIVDTVDGKLSNEEFQNYWKEIGQTVLRMSARHLAEINRKRVLKEHLLALSPIKEDDIRLQRYVLLTERFPHLILQQLIKEYCLETYNDETFISFLQDQKHNLLHKRKKQSYCCICAVKTFSYVIPDSLWYKLYMFKDRKLSHKCKNKQKCVMKFEINFNFDLSQVNTPMLILLILNTPQLLQYTLRHMYSDSITPFLEQYKHSIFHAVDKFVDLKCCNCQDVACTPRKSMLTHDDWMKLFTVKDTAACCVGDCCCNFSVKDNLRIGSLDDTLLFKTMSVAGPFRVFDNCDKNTFNTFLCWDGKNNEYLDANKKLLGAVKNNEFVETLTSKLTLSGQMTDHLDEGYVSNWILKNVSAEKTSSGSKTDLVLLFQDKGDLATQNVTVSSNASVRFSGNDKIIWTQEEANFLKLNYLLNQEACPVVRTEFDRHMPKEKLEGIITDIYYRDLALQEKLNDEKKIDNDIEPLRLSSVQRNRIFLTKQRVYTEETKFFVFEGEAVASSDAIDLSLMIRIFEENRKKMVTLKNNDELYKHLGIIKKIRRTITRSPNGQLTNEEFEEHWNTLSKVVVSLKGEDEFERHLNNLKTQPILKDVH